MKISETGFQISKVNHLRYLQNQHNFEFACVSNEQKANGQAAARQGETFNRMGRKKGMHDLIIFLPMGRIILVEFKRPKTMFQTAGTLSPEQKEWHARCLDLGFETWVIKSDEDWNRLVERLISFYSAS